MKSPQITESSLNELIDMKQDPKRSEFYIKLVQAEITSRVIGQVIWAIYGETDPRGVQTLSIMY